MCPKTYFNDQLCYVEMMKTKIVAYTRRAELNQVRENQVHLALFSEIIQCMAIRLELQSALNFIIAWLKH